MTTPLLYVNGENFSPDDFLESSAWKQKSVIGRKGDIAYGSGGVLESSGFNIEIHNHEFLEMQENLKMIKDFICKHSAELTRLTNFPGVDNIEIGIPIVSRLSSDVIIQGEYIPADFIKLIAQFEIAISLRFCSI